MAVSSTLIHAKKGGNFSYFFKLRVIYFIIKGHFNFITRLGKQKVASELNDKLEK